MAVLFEAPQKIIAKGVSRKIVISTQKTATPSGDRFLISTFERGVTNRNAACASNFVLIRREIEYQTLRRQSENKKLIGLLDILLPGLLPIGIPFKSS